ncbi:MAG: hypothetical protein ACRYGK_12380 [Janthinobacterium lividum]
MRDGTGGGAYAGGDDGCAAALSETEVPVLLAAARAEARMGEPLSMGNLEMLNNDDGLMYW